MNSGRRDVIVIGSGVEELVASADLAQAGLRVTVMERGESPGGPAAGEEILPGFRVDPVFPDAGYLPPATVRDLELEGHGVALLRPDPVLAAPAGAGEPLVLWRDPERTRISIARRSAGDADRWFGFAERIASFAGILEALGSRPPVRPAGPLRELVPYLGVGRKVRSLGGARMAELFRMIPMPASDFLDDTFDDEILKGALGALAVRGVFQGPRSPWTSLVLLHHQVGSPTGVFGPRAIVRGGVGALVTALATIASERGVKIRCGTGVVGITIEKGRAVGVSLASGEEVAAGAVLSGADPARTFLDLAGPQHLDPDFVHAVRQVRFRGGCAKVHLALSEAPRFEGLADPPGGSFVIAPGADAVERAYDDAKHGSVSARPVLAGRIPSLADPSLAPSGRHVMSVDVRFVPLGSGSRSGNGVSAEALGDRVVDLLGEHAPNLPRAVLGRRVLIPTDLSSRYELTGGDPFQGELAPDQLMFMRPVSGWARYRTPIRGLYICGPGTHPAGAITGASGRLAANAIHEDLERDR